ncbi:MAG TPA: hypothetical protein VLE43_00310, partial [Candidatus Saccharimonadia bacterium]|nr:hypothetical protein [Candidatus Saccharimonadia bacterium]
LDAFRTQVRICLDEEQTNPARTNALYWADQAISHFELHPEAPGLEIAARLLKLDVYYDEIQSQPADMTARRSIIQNGMPVFNKMDALMASIPITAEPLQPKVRARIERIGSSFLYESAKPEDAGTGKWDMGTLDLALKHALRSAEYDPAGGRVPILRTLRRIFVEDPDQHRQRVTDQMIKLKLEVERVYRDAKPEELPFLNNYAVLTHEMLVHHNVQPPPEDMIKLHADYAVRLQERVLGYVETSDKARFAVGRKADFIFDLARMTALQAELNQPSQPEAARRYHDYAVSLILRIENDPKIAADSRKMLFKSMFAQPELKQVIQSPELQNIVNYARSLNSP